MRDRTLPMKGGWVLVKVSPPTEIKVPVLSLWWAMAEKTFHQGSSGMGYIGSQYSLPNDGSIDRRLANLWRKRCGAKPRDASDEASIDADLAWLKSNSHHLGGIDEIDLEQRVRILTPQGSVCLNPHEFNIIDDINPYMEMIDDDHLKLMQLDGAKVSKKLADQIFYCRQRGISKKDALTMLLGEINKPSIAYLQFHEGYAEYFGL